MQCVLKVTKPPLTTTGKAAECFHTDGIHHELPDASLD